MSVDESNNLIEVIERVKIAEQDGKVQYNIGADDPCGELDANASVSMNYWVSIHLFSKKMKRVFTPL